MLDGTVEVLLYAVRRSRTEFGARETAVLSLLAGQAAAALQRVRAVAAVERRRERAESLRVIPRTLTATLDADQVLDCFGSALLGASRAERVWCIGVRKISRNARGPLKWIDESGDGARAFAFIVIGVEAQTQVELPEIA